MLLKTEYMHLKTIASVLTLFGLGLSSCFAAPLQCDSKRSSAKNNALCADILTNNRLEVFEKYLTAYLVTDAPPRLIEDSHKAWMKRSQECKNQKCLLQQFDQRLEDLNFYSSMNQSLTQHYIQYNKGKMTEPTVHIQVHQLSKDRIKIEGIALANVNNRSDKQSQSMLAYSTPTQRNEIVDNEQKCKYQMNFQRAVLVVKTKQSGCERFTGVYRLYD